MDRGLLALAALFVMTVLVGQVEMFVLNTNFLWESGSTIQVAFVDWPGRSCSDDMRSLVQRLAPTWSQYANIRFEFIAGNRGDISIECNLGKPHVSAIGTDSRRFDASMNLGWTAEDIALDRQTVETSIIHEFGHALGLRHEQTNPYAPFFIDCNAQNVIEYARRNGVSPQQFCRRFNWDSPNVYYSYFDQQSIMFYAMPEELVGPEVANIVNTRISRLEQYLISLVYPR